MDQRVRAAILLMEKSLHRDLSLEEIAQSVNLSASRFRHLFKAEIGVSPAQYMKSLRMQRARELLDATFLNVKQVMSMAGVRDKGHFIENFKKAYGLTPTQHRARQIRTNSLTKKVAAGR